MPQTNDNRGSGRISEREPSDSEPRLQEEEAKIETFQAFGNDPRQNQPFALKHLFDKTFGA